MPTGKKMKIKQKYWMSSYTTSCPVCGREYTIKQREYSKKPLDWNKRNEFKEVYDYCNSL